MFEDDSDSGESDANNGEPDNDYNSNGEPEDGSDGEDAEN